MDHNQTLTEFRAICIEEAVNFKVPPALMDIIFIRTLFKSKTHRYLIKDYLKDGALYRLMKNWYGSYEVLLNLEQPAIWFDNGILVGADLNVRVKAKYKWEYVVHLLYMDIMPSTRDQIIDRLSRRIKFILRPSYA
jgi:hypothetical protein